MRITAILAVLLAVLAAAFTLTRTTEQDITASNAIAVPVHGTPGSYIASVTLTNTGAADRLLSASVADAAQTEIAGVQEGPAIVVPGKMTSQLAADGLHLRLSGLSGGVTEGSLIPLTLVFEGAGTVTTRLQIARMGAMDHSMHMSGGQETPAPVPTARLDITTPPSQKGLRATLDLQNFALVQTPDGTEHVAGEGHAHLYLNGLKLGRLYTPDVVVGPLLPGDYALRVTLNTHDHQPYLSGEAQIGDEYFFTVGD
jgi:copper(I)-binding protein